LNIEVYSDGADLDAMAAAYREGLVDGFTTNPTLMAKAGIASYRGFAGDVLAMIPDLPICFQVIADEFEEMGAQAREIGSWSENVFVKIPVTNTRGESSGPLIRELSAEGVKLNVTAVLTPTQAAEVIDAMSLETPAMISVFAGRIADTGLEPAPVMREIVALARRRPELRVLWASPREVLNVYEAEACGCHAIALTSELFGKLRLRNKELDEFSRETVEMFYDDACRAGYVL
jgi:transaldolase